MKLAIVVPCFNEEEVLPSTLTILGSLLQHMIDDSQISADSNLLFVDDGSKDQTWQLLCNATRQTEYVRALRLSRNCGHQNALLAGLKAADADVVVSIDADLQDDVAAIVTMVAEARNGADIVYGVRKQRYVDTLFKRASAEMYYKTLKLLGVEVVFNHADFRLMSRRALNALFQFDEVNLFLRGIIPKLGFNTTVVYYDRSERLAGTSKYPIRKMFALAWEGITSFSIVPLRVITALGVLTCIGSLAIGAWALGLGLMTDRAVPGWTSIVVPMVLMGGVQLLSLGIIGEYIGKIYIETKSRPSYFVAERVPDWTQPQ